MIERIEFEILEFLVRRKSQVTLKQVHSNVLGHKEAELKSWLITMAMKDLIKVIEGEGDIKYVLALKGFQEWDDFKR